MSKSKRCRPDRRFYQIFAVIGLVCTLPIAAATGASAQQQQYGYSQGSDYGGANYNARYAGFGGRVGPSFGGGLNNIAQPVQSPPYNNQPPNNRTMQKLQKELNAVDAPQYWQQSGPGPVLQPAPAPVQQMGSPASFVRQEMLRTFFGAGPGSTYPSSPNTGASGSATGQAYSYYQTASNQARRAYNYGQQARYNQDKWSRKNAASSAEYAAEAAESAAQSAYQISQSGDSKARGYASQARAAANRARADANRARYNADTIH